jgi:hypothetical protein
MQHIQKLKRMDHSCDLGVDGCEGVDLTQLLQGEVHWRSVLNSLPLKSAAERTSASQGPSCTELIG